MKLHVPFYKSRKDTDCGPLALKMVLEFFGERHAFQEIARLEKRLSSGMVWSLGIARAAKKLGFPVRFFSTANFDVHDLKFYKKYANDKAMLVLKQLQKEMKQSMAEKDLSLKELLAYVSERSVPIVLVNWFVIAGKDGFTGHFLPVTGHDTKYVYVNNSGIARAKAHLPIPKTVFLKAWESKGTDKDTIIIFRK
ncbi:MAG: peptidase C39 family protein [archaeon]